MREEFEPQIVGFLCHWCSSMAADLAGTSRMTYPPNLKIIRVMCSSRVDPVQVVKSLLDGADGVMVAGCHPGDCHYQVGNYFTRRRMALTKKVLETLGLEVERVKLYWISAAEGGKFVQVAREFTQKIKDLGPNPASREPFL